MPRRYPARPGAEALGELGGDAVGEAEVLLPGGIDAVDGDDDPDAVVGRLGGMAEAEADVGGAAVLLAGVTGPARGDDVVPGMAAAAALGDDVVDVLGGAPAVLALELVPNEHGAARERRPGAVGHLHEVVETDDAGPGNAEGLGAEHDPVGVKDVGLAFQGKDERPPHGHNAQRLVRSVENQRSSQGMRSIDAGSL